MEFTIIASLLVAGFIFAVTPGPGVLAVLSLSARYGFRPGFFMGSGEVLGDVVYMGVAIVSLGAVAETMAPAMGVVRVVGGLYLVYLGAQTVWDTLKAGSERTPMRDDAQQTMNPWLALAMGFGISVTNPKVVVFYFSFFPLFVDLNALTVVDALGTVAALGMGVWLGISSIALLGDKGARLLFESGSGLWIQRLTGVLVAAAGVYLCFS